MKQKQFSPLSVAEMAISLFAANQGFLDDVPVKKVVDFEHALLGYIKNHHTDLLKKVNEKPDYNDDIALAFKKAVEDFKTNHSW